MATSEKQLDKLRSAVVTLDRLAEQYPDYSRQIGIAMSVVNQEIERLKQEADGDE